MMWPPPSPGPGPGGAAVRPGAAPGPAPGVLLRLRARPRRLWRGAGGPAPPRGAFGRTRLSSLSSPPSPSHGRSTARRPTASRGATRSPADAARGEAPGRAAASGVAGHWNTCRAGGAREKGVSRGVLARWRRGCDGPVAAAHPHGRARRRRGRRVPNRRGDGGPRRCEGRACGWGDSREGARGDSREDVRGGVWGDGRDAILRQEDPHGDVLSCDGGEIGARDARVRKGAPGLLRRSADGRPAPRWTHLPWAQASPAKKKSVPVTLPSPSSKT